MPGCWQFLVKKSTTDRILFPICYLLSLCSKPLVWRWRWSSDTSTSSKKKKKKTTNQIFASSLLHTTKSDIKFMGLVLCFSPRLCTLLTRFCHFSFKLSISALCKGCRDETPTETWATKDNHRGKTSRVKTSTTNRLLCCHSHLNSHHLDLLSCAALLIRNTP